MIGWLTLTLDVFKYNEIEKEAQRKGGLTLTLDVFK